MSLVRMFKEMAGVQRGALKFFRTTHSYVLVPTIRSKEIQRAKLWQRLSKNPCWTKDMMIEKFPIKADDQGREMIFSFTRGTRCYDLSKSDLFPVLVSDDGTKSLIVRPPICRGCEHYGTTRGPRRGTIPFCALHRDRNKTLISDTVQKASDDVARMRL